MASLAEIRAKLKEQETKSSGNQGGGDNAVYPFWNLKEGQESVVRFLPDGDANNTFFWVERAMIKLFLEHIEEERNGLTGLLDSYYCWKKEVEEKKTELIIILRTSCLN